MRFESFGEENLAIDDTYGIEKIQCLSCGYICDIYKPKDKMCRNCRSTDTICKSSVTYRKKNKEND
jgi:uncharacterized OB-fold protein